MACSFTSVKSLLKYFRLNEGHPGHAVKHQPPSSPSPFSLNRFTLFFVSNNLSLFQTRDLIICVHCCTEHSLCTAFNPTGLTWDLSFGSFTRLQKNSVPPQSHIFNSCPSPSLLVQTALGNPLDTTLV